MQEAEAAETGQHASPVKAPAWPGLSAEAGQRAADSALTQQEDITGDGATWRADEDSLRQALEKAVAEPIDPSRRFLWTDTSTGVILILILIFLNSRMYSMQEHAWENVLPPCKGGATGLNV